MPRLARPRATARSRELAEMRDLAEVGEHRKLKNCPQSRPAGQQQARGRKRRDDGSEPSGISTWGANDGFTTVRASSLA